MAALLLSAGLSHFLAPRFYDRLIPSWLPPSARFWTNASGAVELVAGAALLNRRTSKAGAWAALALLVGVYPGNIKDTVDHWPPNSARGIGSVVRLPLQFPLIAWAWRLAHT
jgi:uncharacterized membrane protein